MPNSLYAYDREGKPGWRIIDEATNEDAFGSNVFALTKQCAVQLIETYHGAEPRPITRAPRLRDD